jgi:hypothetical protein
MALLLVISHVRVRRRVFRKPYKYAGQTVFSTAEIAQVRCGGDISRSVVQIQMLHFRCTAPWKRIATALQTTLATADEFFEWSQPLHRQFDGNSYGYQKHAAPIPLHAPVDA